MLEKHPVVIVQGQTGSGKTTQLTQYGRLPFTEGAQHHAILAGISTAAG